MRGFVANAMMPQVQGDGYHNVVGFQRYCSDCILHCVIGVQWQADSDQALVVLLVLLPDWI